VEEVIQKIETKNNWLLWLLIGACGLIASGYFNYSKIKAQQEYIMEVISELDCVGDKNGIPK
jgi:hypothetical protein